MKKTYEVPKVFEYGLVRDMIHPIQSLING